MPPPLLLEGLRQEWRDPRGALIASAATDGSRWWMRWPATGTFAFERSGDIIVDAEPGVSAPDVEDTFLRGVLPIVFLARGYEALHASAALIGGRVVAFAAESGTGKSTLAAAVMRTGGARWADDTLVWRLENGVPVTVALPHPQRLDAAAHAAIGRIGTTPSATPPGTVAPLAALYLIARGESALCAEFGRLAPQVAFRRVLAHAHSFELAEGRSRTLVEQLIALVSNVPVFELKIRSGLEHLPVVASIVQRHAASVLQG